MGVQLDLCLTGSSQHEILKEYLSREQPRLQVDAKIGPCPDGSCCEGCDVTLFVGGVWYKILENSCIAGCCDNLD